MLGLVPRTQCEITSHIWVTITTLCHCCVSTSHSRSQIQVSFKILKWKTPWAMYCIARFLDICKVFWIYGLPAYVRFKYQSQMEIHTGQETNTHLSESNSRHLVQLTNKILCLLPLTPRLTSDFLVSVGIYLNKFIWHQETLVERFYSC